MAAVTAEITSELSTAEGGVPVGLLLSLSAVVLA
jgi:hypothetical protein